MLRGKKTGDVTEDIFTFRFHDRFWGHNFLHGGFGAEDGREHVSLLLHFLGLDRNNGFGDWRSWENGICNTRYETALFGQQNRAELPGRMDTASRSGGEGKKAI